jgi:hypothetical protein
MRPERALFRILISALQVLGQEEPQFIAVISTARQPFSIITFKRFENFVKYAN